MTRHRRRKKKVELRKRIRKQRGRSIEEWMNNYPRKLFNGKSSKEMYDIELKQYIS